MFWCHPDGAVEVKVVNRPSLTESLYTNTPIDDVALAYDNDFIAKVVVAAKEWEEEQQAQRKRDKDLAFALSSFTLGTLVGFVIGWCTCYLIVV